MAAQDVAAQPIMDWSAALSGWSISDVGLWLRSLPEPLQQQLQQQPGAPTAADAPPPPPPWDASAGSVSDLLTELGPQLKPYEETFAEYELQSVGQLTALGREGMLQELRGLGVTRDHREKIERLAFSPRPCGASGGAFSRAFLAECRPLHAAHMGCENMGPMLYSLCRFVKPGRVLEIGAGYTSLWLLQALADNAEELRRCAQSQVEDGYQVEGGSWLLGEETPRAAAAAAAAEPCFSARRGWPSRHDRGVLHCVDDCSHAHTTAHRVREAAARLGLAPHLRLHICDAYGLADTFDEALASDRDGGGGEGGGASLPSEGDDEEEDDGMLDVLWLDFGAGVGGRLSAFLAAWWPRLRPGGLLLMHSTLTNSLTRRWLDGMRARQRPNATGTTGAGPEDGAEGGAEGDEGADGAPGAAGADDSPLGDEFVELSLYEPHKRYQNSFSIFQRRPAGWGGEPVHTNYP